MQAIKKNVMENKGFKSIEKKTCIYVCMYVCVRERERERGGGGGGNHNIRRAMNKSESSDFIFHYYS